MKAGVLLTLVDVLLTEDTTEALTALTPEAGHQVVTSPVLGENNLFKSNFRSKTDLLGYFCMKKKNKINFKVNYFLFPLHWFSTQSLMLTFKVGNCKLFL